MCLFKPPVWNLYIRLLYLRGGDLYSEEAGGLLHDGCVRSHPAHRRALLALLLDQPWRQRRSCAFGYFIQSSVPPQASAPHLISPVLHPPNWPSHVSFPRSTNVTPTIHLWVWDWPFLSFKSHKGSYSIFSSVACPKASARKCNAYPGYFLHDFPSASSVAHRHAFAMGTAQVSERWWSEMEITWDAVKCESGASEL